MRLAPAAAAVAAVLFAGCGEATVTSGSTTTATQSGTLALARCSELEAAQRAPLDGPAAADAEVAAWQRDRADVGPPSDEASTLAAAAAEHDPTTEVGRMSTELGFPMTDDESAESIERNRRASGLADRARPLLPDDGTVLLALDNRHGTIDVMTSGDAAALQAALDEALGAGQAEVIPVTRGPGELQDLAARIQGFLDEQGVRWADMWSGNRLARVNIFLEVLEPEDVAALAAAFPDDVDALCVDGMDPADVIPDGPQPTEGDGWRLLADEPGIGRPYATGAAATTAELDALWAEIGLPGEPPDVDFATEVVAWFGPAVSGSCSNIRMDDVVIDSATASVYPEIVLPGGARSCTDDANPHAYVVALARDHLPGGRFVVTIRPPNAECCPEGETPVALG